MHDSLSALLAGASSALLLLESELRCKCLLLLLLVLPPEVAGCLGDFLGRDDLCALLIGFSQGIKLLEQLVLFTFLSLFGGTD